MTSARRQLPRLRVRPRVRGALVAALMLPFALGGVAWAAFTATTSSTGNSVAIAGSWSTSQSAGTDGCVSDTGSSGTCADLRALGGVAETATDPEGKHVYAASSTTKAVAVFSRNATTGALTQATGTAGCVSDSGADGCTFGRGLGDGPGDIAVSPDGAHVYAASGGATNGTVSVFARNATTGTLSQLGGTSGCVSQTDTGEFCRVLRGLTDAADVAVSPDGRSVYVASPIQDTVAVLVRDTATGALSQATGTAGCISETGAGTCVDGRALDAPRAVTVSPDNKHVYVASGTSNAVAALTRDTTTGALAPIAGVTGCVSETGSDGCTDGRGLSGPRGVTIGAQGADVYVASANVPAATHLRRDSTSGGLSQAADASACWTDSATGGCGNGIALDGAIDVTADPRDARLWVAAETADSVVTFYRTDAGVLVRPPGTAACISQSGTSGACNVGRGLDGARHVTVSPDGQFHYVSASASSAIAVLPR